MPHFLIKYQRRVVEVEEFSEIIDAENEAAAREQANASAWEMDGNCPDEIESVSFDAESWFVREINETAA